MEADSPALAQTMMVYAMASCLRSISAICATELAFWPMAT